MYVCVCVHETACVTSVREGATNSPRAMREFSQTRKRCTDVCVCVRVLYVHVDVYIHNIIFGVGNVYVRVCVCISNGVCVWLCECVCVSTFADEKYIWSIVVALYRVYSVHDARQVQGDPPPPHSFYVQATHGDWYGDDDDVDWVSGGWRRRRCRRRRCKEVFV